MPKLTKRTVEATKPQAREVFVWDDALPGFGLRVLPSGRRSYVIQYRAKGRSRRFALGLHGVLTADEARNRAAGLLADVRRGGDPAAERKAALQAPTVAQLFDRFVEDYALGRKKARSVREDRRLGAKHVLPALGHLRVADVLHTDALRLHNGLRETPILANRVLALASTLFRVAETWGLRSPGSNPCRGVERFPERARVRYASNAELARLGEALAVAERAETLSREAIAALRLLAFTGCRVSEVLLLTWAEVDLERRELRLRDSKTGPKTVTLNAPAVELLAGLSQRTAASERCSEWVFPSKNPADPIRSLEVAWKRICAAAALEDLRMHDLRHSFASIGAASGHSLLVIGALLGHKRAATTQRYAHLADDPVRSATEAIGSRIAAQLGGTSAGVVPLREVAPAQ